MHDRSRARARPGAKRTARTPAAPTPQRAAHALTAVSLQPAAPDIGQPKLKKLSGKPAAVRKRRGTERKNAGSIVLPPGTVLDEDLLDALADQLGAFIGRDRNNPHDVAEAVLDILREAVLSR